MLGRLVSAFAMILVAASPAYAASISFSDDFNTGTASAQWSNTAGTWSATSFNYLATAPTNSPTTFTLLPYDLLDFTVDVDVNNASDGGIWLRSDATRSNALLLVIGGNSHTGTGFYFHQIVGGVFSGNLNSVGGLFTQGDEIHVQVVVAGNTYSVYLNGGSTAVTSLTWIGGPTSGFTGLYDFGGTANTGIQSFDNFNLRGNTVGAAAVPEPATLGLFGAGLGVLAAIRRRRR